VATPSSNDERGLPSAPDELANRLPMATNGRLNRSATLGNNSETPNTKTSASAIHRPY
jgi:hypothetical protein